MNETISLLNDVEVLKTDLRNYMINAGKELSDNSLMSYNILLYDLLTELYPDSSISITAQWDNENRVDSFMAYLFDFKKNLYEYIIQLNSALLPAGEQDKYPMSVYNEGIKFLLENVTVDQSLSHHYLLMYGGRETSGVLNYSMTSYNDWINKYKSTSIKECENNTATNILNDNIFRTNRPEFLLGKSYNYIFIDYIHITSNDIIGKNPNLLVPAGISDEAVKVYYSWVPNSSTHTWDYIIDMDAEPLYINDVMEKGLDGKYVFKKDYKWSAIDYTNYIVYRRKLDYTSINKGIVNISLKDAIDSWSTSDYRKAESEIFFRNQMLDAINSMTPEQQSQLLFRNLQISDIHIFNKATPIFIYPHWNDEFHRKGYIFDSNISANGEYNVSTEYVNIKLYKEDTETDSSYTASTYSLSFPSLKYGNNENYFEKNNLPLNVPDASITWNITPNIPLQEYSITMYNDTAGSNLGDIEEFTIDIDKVPGNANDFNADAGYHVDLTNFSNYYVKEMTDTYAVIKIGYTPNIVSNVKVSLRNKSNQSIISNEIAGISFKNTKQDSSGGGSENGNNNSSTGGNNSSTGGNEGGGSSSTQEMINLNIHYKVIFKNFDPVTDGNNLYNNVSIPLNPTNPYILTIDVKNPDSNWMPQNILRWNDDVVSKYKTLSTSGDNWLYYIKDETNGIIRFTVNDNYPIGYSSQANVYNIENNIYYNNSYVIPNNNGVYKHLFFGPCDSSANWKTSWFMKTIQIPRNSDVRVFGLDLFNYSTTDCKFELTHPDHTTKNFKLDWINFTAKRQGNTIQDSSTYILEQSTEPYSFNIGADNSYDLYYVLIFNGT